MALVLLYFMLIFSVEVCSKSVQNATIDGTKYVTVETFEALRRNLTDMIADISTGDSVKKEEKHVFFYVQLTSDRTYNHHSIVRFDKVLYNEGNHFNPDDSVFVAPVTGLYLFSWTVQSSSAKYTNTELRVGSEIKETLHMELGGSSGRFSSSRILVCKVNRNNHVWIQTTNRYGAAHFFDDEYGSRSSFMGVFLSKS